MLINIGNNAEMKEVYMRWGYEVL